MNPCGMVVDVLSSGYEVDCRFIENSDQLGKLYWYECQPGAKALPFPTAFCSSVWEQDRDRSGPGEVDFAGKTWVSKKGPALPGDHWHGDPSWFLHGIPADLPPLPTGAYSCTGASQLGRGGAALGGQSPASLFTGRGGAALGGRGVGTGQIPRGGAALGGRSPQTGPAVQVGRGGAALGGQAVQGDQGIDSPCRPARNLPAQMWLALGAGPECAPNAGGVFPMVYDSVTGRWVSPLIVIGFPVNCTVTVECDDPDWVWRLLQSGTTQLDTGTATVVDDDPLTLTFATGVFTTCPMTVSEYHP